MFNKKSEPETPAVPETAEAVSEFPIKGQSGSGSTLGYSVEARSTFSRPQPFGEIVLDERWLRIYFPKGPIGVPAENRFTSTGLRECSLLPYASAEALRWWFLAEIEKGIGGMCVETRIVQHQVKYQYSEEIVGRDEVVDAEYRRKSSHVFKAVQS